MVTLLWRLLGAILLPVLLIPGTPAQAQAKIINGINVLPDTWPFMASLFATSQGTPQAGHFCGGTLISDRHVLTAAHCVDAYKDSPGSIKATIGRLRLSQGGGGITSSIEKILIHPRFKQEKSQSFDIAIIQLKAPVTIPPIARLNSPTTDGATFGTPLTILGWGSMDATLTVRPDILQQASIPRIADQACSDRLGLDFNPETMLCAGILASSPIAQDGVDACYGDSGGPLIGVIDGQPTLVGITSWGYACASDRYWGVYTKVATLNSWIQSKISTTPINLQAPSIVTIKRSPRTLRCLPGKWNTQGRNSRVSIRWYREDGSTAGKQPIYQLSAADYGESLRCEVTVATTGSEGENISSSQSAPSELLLPKFIPVTTEGPIKAVARTCTNKECRLFVKVATTTAISSLTAKLTRSCSTGSCLNEQNIQMITPTIGIFRITRATQDTQGRIGIKGGFSASQTSYSFIIPGKTPPGAT